MSSTKLQSPEIKTTREIWGRAHKISGLIGFISAALLILTPFWVSYLWISCTHYHCAIRSPLDELLATNSASAAVSLLKSKLPAYDAEATRIYLGWLAFQVLMYYIVPGKVGYGQRTPAGHILKYTVNGLNVWVITHILFIGLGLAGVFRLSVIADHWGGLLIITNVCGYILAAFAYIKANLFPTHDRDVKFSGNILYDIFMGVELNPRIKDFDFKLFFNGRPGIIAWTLINLSFGAAQYYQLGYVTNSMILLNILHAIYVVDFFYFEDWYLRTIDIAHDHFGYYLAWGDLVWLPFTYTLQSHYAYRNPVDLSPVEFSLILALGLIGYYIFRNANNQKDVVRKLNGNANIWGSPATFISASYSTGDKKTSKSILLTSGFWGISRHFNYIGDLLMCTAFGASVCGLKQFHFMPYYYLLYMTVLLVHRIQRDHSRCSAKYGIYWDQYCKVVPYKLIPYVF
ncbi:hypothetical protein BB560_003272 [Smittium megazygosporum]|uniref:7-dehydrocholesterol reductase n=1 Tax=Smittium megazygosporum TaxID=133381 RepID=A0A2T9ZCF7_9FUNG|nr:hypothetical protein BB560_003272 [Smittium megazygosporum]